MHQFRSKSTIFRFRFVSFLLCLNYLLAPTAAVILVCSLIQSDHLLTHIAIVLGILMSLILILQWLVAAHTRCPLCMTPVLAKNGCSKNNRARPLLGSYRLRVALNILFQGSFRCPYCNEPVAMRVRSHHHS